MALPGLAGYRLACWLNRGYVDLIRAIPLLVLLPPLGNQFIYSLKMSALASIIDMEALTRRANELVVNAYRPLEIYTFPILEHLLVSWLVRRLEARMGASEATRT